MAPILKKTYLRRNKESYNSLEKENVDPFDELLSSPLKQQVEFKPLSFWRKTFKKRKSQNNVKKLKCGLYELSDSDNALSPVQKKKKIRNECLDRRTKKLQLRKTNYSSETNCNSSDINSSIKLKNNVTNFTFKNCKKVSKISPVKDELNLQFVTTNRQFFLRKCKNFFLTNETSCEKVKSFYNSKEQSLSPYHESQVESPIVNKFVAAEDELYYENKEHSLNFDSSCSALCSSESGPLAIKPLPLLNNASNDSNSSSEEVNCFENSFFSEENILSDFDVLSLVNIFSNMELEDSKFNQIYSEILELFNGPSTSETSTLNVSNYSTPKSDFANSDKDDSHTFSKNSMPCEKSFLQLHGSAKKEEKNLDQLESFPPKIVKPLITLMSDMTLSIENSNSDTLKSEVCDSKLKLGPDTQEDFNEFSNDIFRNVTTKRRFDDTSFSKKSAYSGQKKYSEKKIENSLEKPVECVFSYKEDRISLPWERLSRLSVPIFESTRVISEKDSEGMGKTEKTNESNINLGMSFNCLEHSLVLKSGKKWVRSMSVLKQIQNGTIGSNHFNDSRIKGKKFQSFVQEMAEMQNEVSISSPVMPGKMQQTLINRTRNISEKSFLFQSASESSLKREFSNEKIDFSYLSDTQLPSKKFDRTLLNHTVKIIQPQEFFEEPSAFKSALNLNAEISKSEDLFLERDESSVISPKDFILAQCGQHEILPFEEYFNEKTLNNCKKIGEGVYGEVFMYNSDTVLKIIPIEGTEKVNGEPQKKFEEILSEIVIAMKLSNLRKGEKYRTSGFSEMKRCWCVYGKYPEYLLKLWDDYDCNGAGSENDSPVLFKSDQLYIILELANGGKNLESFVFNSSEQSLSIFTQTAFSLAAAEQAFQFEHRDLHWGNLLIAPTNDKFVAVVLKGIEFKIPTKGVKVSVIDFTLSRISHEGCCIFNDLSVDPTFFVSQGDYQFEIYRMMQQVLKNDWSTFMPKTNIYWMHYILDKMLNMVRYKNKKTQTHKKYLKRLKVLENIILKHEDSLDFVLTEDLVEKKV